MTDEEDRWVTFGIDEHGNPTRSSRATIARPMWGCASRRGPRDARGILHELDCGVRYYRSVRDAQGRSGFAFLPISLLAGLAEDYALAVGSGGPELIAERYPELATAIVAARFQLSRTDPESGPQPEVPSPCDDTARGQK